MSKKLDNLNYKRIKITAKVFGAFILSVFCFGIVLSVGGNFHLPVTPCFYLGKTEQLTPAYPCISAISWQGYQFIMIGIIAGLTYGWYQLFNGRMLKK
jgi:hypothetical protein